MRGPPACGRAREGRLMSHLWSGRFDAAPDAAVFEFGVSFRFDRRLFEDDVTGSLAWAEALARRRRPLRRRRRAPSPAALREILDAGRRDPGVRRRRRRGRALLRRAPARRARRRRRQAAAHRPLAQRAGVARPAALPQAAHPGAASTGVWRASSAALRRAGRGGGDGADAVLHAPAPRAADARRRTSSWRTRRRFGATTRGSARRATKPTRCRSARAPSPAPPTPSTRRRSRGASASRASSPTASTRRRTATSSRLPPRVRARDGAPEPARRGRHHLHVARSSASSSCPTASRPAAA